MTTFLDPAAAGVASAPGYASGSYYGGFSTGSTQTMTANTLYLWPVQIGLTSVVDRVAFQTGAAVVGNAKVGIYDASAAGGRPGNLIRENNADLSTNTGVAIIAGSFASNPTLSPGWYWLAVCFSAAADIRSATGAGTAGVAYAYQAGGSADGFAIGGGNPSIKRTAALTYVAGPTAFFPATCGAITVTDAVPATPILEWRAL